MALIKCSNCGNMVSDKATKCPKCGTPIGRPVEKQEKKVSPEPKAVEVKSKDNKPWLIGLLAFLLLAAVGYLAYDKLIVPKDREQSEKDMGKPHASAILKGIVGDGIGNVLRLTFNNGEVEGTEHYDSQRSGLTISIKGTIDEDGKLLLYEYDNGKECGRYEGHYDGKNYNGFFYGSSGNTLPFSAMVVDEHQLEDMLKDSERRLIVKAFKKKLESLAKDSDCDYFLYDITENDIPELWIKTGTCEADYTLMVYTYESGKCKNICERPAGHSVFYEGSDYILQQYAHQGFATWVKLTYNGSKITEKTIFEEDINGTDNDYKQPEEMYIELYPVNNDHPIRQAFGME